MAPRGNHLFGPFDFDPRTGRLTKHGHRIKLQPKSAVILSRLLGQPGAIVSHSELQSALWPDGTYVDFELGIRVGVKKLRAALDERSDEPVYIQTVYGEGYRFIAPVCWKEAATPPEPAHAAIPAVPQEPAPPMRMIRNKAFSAGTIAVTAAVALSGLSWTARSNSLHFHNRDWVVIAAFENRTGEKLLDGSVEFALARELSRSSYLNVAPPDRVGDTLKLMRQKPDAVLTEELARQVASRDGGIRAVLAGRVEQFAKKYVLTVRVVNPLNGESVSVLDREGSQEQLPALARSLSEELLRKLGEPAVNASAAGAQRLEKATTPSLAALAAFSAGMRRVNAQEWLHATELLEEAVRSDARFALAHIYVAHCFSNLNQPGRAAPHYEAAFQLAPDVRDRERLFILGSYYARFVRDDRRAQGYYEALTDLYPDDYWGVNNLMMTYRRLGMVAEARATGERLIPLRPNSAANLTTATELWWYYRRDHPDPAKSRLYGDLLRSERSKGDAGPPSERSFHGVDLDLEGASDRWWKGDVEGAARELDRVSSHGTAQADDRYTNYMAAANLVLGRIGVARQICGHVGEFRARSGCLLRVASVAGDSASAKEQLRQLRITGPTEVGGWITDVAVALQTGEMVTAKRWLEARGPLNPLANGLVLLAQGRTQEGIVELQKNPPWMGSSGAHWGVLRQHLALATALERQGRIDEAIALLQHDTRPNTAEFLSGYEWPECRMKLAALHRKAGRADEALMVEDEIRHYLSAADANHPVLVHLGGRDATRAKAMRE